MGTAASVELLEIQYADRCYERYIVIAGGRITCLRCTAKSGRTKQQCRKPALKTSRTQKCGHHGGKPRPKIKHGLETLAARSERSQESAMLSALEDAMTVLGMTTSPRTRGRKASGYQPVRTLADVMRLMERTQWKRSNGQ
jgi:hypothetical protein